MAEITKVTTPLIPRENLGKNRPVTEQAFELNNPQKVNRPADDSKIRDHDTAGQSLREMLGRGAMAPVLRNSADLIQQIQKMITVLEMGASTSEIAMQDPIRELLSSMFVSTDELLGLLMEQDASATLFKGDSFNVLRDIAQRFEGNPNVKSAITSLLKSFEFNVNLDNSVKTILYNCENLLDYMFSNDREQFGAYLDSLADTLLPEPAGQETQIHEGNGAPVMLGKDGLPQNEAAQNQTFLADLPQDEALPDRAAQNQALQDAALQKDMPQNRAPYEALRETPYANAHLSVDPKEAAGLLKNNLLPLLGEIVVKYYQNESIRDIVMVVVHNIVRVDKGTPEALQEAVDNLEDILSRIANLNENFGKNLAETLSQASEKAKAAGNDVMEKISDVLSKVLRSPDSSPVAFRQAENMLMSMLHNQSSVMNVLHYILPLETPDDRIYAEMYVDPDSEEASGGREGEKGHKVFLSVESENHGSIELCFWENGGRVELSMWCPGALVEPVAAMKKTIQSLMLAHGYTMTGFSVDELTKHHSIIQVFPKLLDRKVGIDVRI